MNSLHLGLWLWVMGVTLHGRGRGGAKPLLLWPRLKEKRRPALQFPPNIPLGPPLTVATTPGKHYPRVQTFNTWALADIPDPIYSSSKSLPTADLRSHGYFSVSPHPSPHNHPSNPTPRKGDLMSWASSQCISKSYLSLYRGWWA